MYPDPLSALTIPARIIFIGIENLEAVLTVSMFIGIWKVHDWI